MSMKGRFEGSVVGSSRCQTDRFRSAEASVWMTFRGEIDGIAFRSEEVSELQAIFMPCRLSEEIRGRAATNPNEEAPEPTKEGEAEARTGSLFGGPDVTSVTIKGAGVTIKGAGREVTFTKKEGDELRSEIGRASCRERV